MSRSMILAVDDSQFLHWKKLADEACDAMEQVRKNNGLLIEVAAQHPLIDGIYPNPEFSARLDAAIKRYELERENRETVKIYVPGSRHMQNGIADRISLSEAGCNYLEMHGVDPADLYGEDANLKYKGDDGVYNSSDECYVAASLFRDLGFGRLASYCSPAQLMRKALSYIQFGVLPDMYSVPCDDMFHDYVDEVFIHIPVFLGDGTGLQADSDEAKRLREIRKPVE